MSKDEIKFKGVMGKEAVISFLEDVISAMKQGVLTIEGRGEAVSLKPCQSIEMEVKVKSKEEKEKVEIELSWRLDKELKITPLEVAVSSRELTDHESGRAVSENPEPQAEPKSPAKSGPAIAVHD
jgi:amphi-Trp domain-containing protein